MTIAIRCDDSLLVREIDGEVVILDTVSNRVHQLNRTASFIWQRCRQPTSAEALAAALVAEFEVDEKTALDDVIRVVTTLKSLDLLLAGG